MKRQSMWLLIEGNEVVEIIMAGIYLPKYFFLLKNV